MIKHRRTKRLALAARLSKLPVTAALQDVMPVAMTFFRQFARSVEGSTVEHLWSLTSQGSVVKIRGAEDHVVGPDLPDGVLSLIDVHSHPSVSGRDAGARFMHVHDILSVYTRPSGIFATGAVLVQPKDFPLRYVVACRPTTRMLTRFLEGDRATYWAFIEELEQLDASKFYSKAHQAGTLDELRDVYASAFQRLDFATHVLDGVSRPVRSRLSR